MTVDFHTHTFPDAIAAAALQKLSGVSHIHPFTDGTAGGLLASMQHAAVDCSIILPVATSPRQVRHINDSAARTNARYALDGLFSFGCIHPECENWREELDHAAALGLKGIKIHPVYQGADLDDIRFLRIMEHCGELDLIVVTHGGVDIGYPEQLRCTPAMARSALRQVGPLTFVMAHMGGWRNWDVVGDLLADTTACLDTSFSTGFITPTAPGFYTPDELRLLNEEEFVRMVRTFGVHRILFGTDSPWSGQKESADWLKNLSGLTAAEKNAILGGNAQRILHLN